MNVKRICLVLLLVMVVAGVVFAQSTGDQGVIVQVLGLGGGYRIEVLNHNTYTVSVEFTCTVTDTRSGKAENFEGQLVLTAKNRELVRQSWPRTTRFSNIKITNVRRF